MAVLRYSWWWFACFLAWWGWEAAFVTHSSGLNLALLVVGLRLVFMAVSQDQIQWWWWPAQESRGTQQFSSHRNMGIWSVTKSKLSKYPNKSTTTTSTQNANKTIKARRQPKNNERKKKYDNVYQTLYVAWLKKLRKSKQAVRWRPHQTVPTSIVHMHKSNTT